MTATHKTTARRYFESVINGGDLPVVDEIFSSAIRFHYPLGELSGSAAVKSYIRTFLTAFPDIRFTVADYIGEGNHVATRWSLTGSQTGEFKGKAPTNKKVSVPGITIMQFEDGKIDEMWVSFDPVHLVGSD